MKQSKPYPKPTTKMVIDQTLRGYYAMNAPDVPDWFLQGFVPNKEHEFVDNDEVFFAWRIYYADRMIEQEFKK